jgi:hypothetical protein
VGPAFLGGFVMKKIVFNGKDYLVFKEINQNLENKNLKTLQSAPKTDKNSLIHQVFYELLEERHGKVTSLNLAMKCGKNGLNITGKEANDFLTNKAKDFNHKYKVGPNGEIVYDFEYLRTCPKSLA